MIGAVILKLALSGAMDDLNHRRKDKIVASYAEDAIILYSGKFSMSGTRKGKGPQGSSSTSISTSLSRSTARPGRPTSRTSSHWG